MLPIALLALAATGTGLRDYCPERPGLDTPACIVDAGHVSVETGLVDWTRESDADTFLLGDTLLRLGVTGGSEVQLGWSPVGIERDRSTHDRTTRVGDVYLGVKTTVRHPDGDGFALALLPSVTLPVGRSPIGAGTWGAGLRVPASVQLSDTIKLDATPEIDAAPDDDGHGRHPSFGTAGGMEIDLSDAVTVAIEGQVMRDRDPGDHATMVLASTSVAWGVSDDLQLDAGAVAGLDRASPDVELYVGVSRRF